MDIATVVLLGLQRSHDGVFAWMSAINQDGSIASPSRTALAQLPAGLYARRDGLLADWQSVCAARDVRAAWPAFWRIFWSTISEPRERAPSAMPQAQPKESKPVATAAHPRAYRGTKFQPPKPASVKVRLAECLMDERLLDVFFASHDFSSLPVLDMDGQEFPRASATPPTASGLVAEQAAWPSDAFPLLPAAFRRACLWQLRMQPLPLLLAWLTVWRAFGAVHQGGAVWQTMPLAQQVDAGDGITLALETDPLEILMLGTYVGSCLGLGGLCDYSAIACLLDANKQVIYARNASGRVLARQLLAIDEQDRLLCFSIYPLTTNAVLSQAFQTFNQAVASALGIALYTRHDDNGYYIPTILARSWWDDGLSNEEQVGTAPSAVDLKGANAW